MITASMPNIFTDDIAQAAAFYRDLLGFAEIDWAPPQGEPEHVVMSLGDSRLALSTSRAINLVGLQPSRGQPFELILWCDDTDQETSRLQEAGASVVIAPYDHIGGHRRAYLLDPDGNWIALVDAR